MPPKKIRSRKADAAAPHGYDENGQAIEKYGRNLDGSIRKVAKRTTATAGAAQVNATSAPKTTAASSRPTRNQREVAQQATEEPQADVPTVSGRSRRGVRDRIPDTNAANGLDLPPAVEKGPRASKVKKNKKTPASVETARRIACIQKIVVASRSALRGEEIKGLKGVVDILATVIEQLDDLSKNAEVES